MASLTSSLCLCFFILSALTSTLQITHARDSQFFGKVSRNRKVDNNPNNNNYYNRETENTHLSNQQEQEQEQYEQPNFIPQTTASGYGLYGHETGLDAPSTATATTSLYNVEDNSYKKQNNNNMMFNNGDNNNNENDNMFEEKNYAPELKGLNEFSYKTDVGSSKYVAGDNYGNDNNNNNNGEGTYVAGNSYNNNGEGKYVGESNYQNNKNGNYYAGRTGYNGGVAVEKQGMSDTRYLENGKYFYDLNSENTFDPTNNNNNYYNNNNNNRKISDHYDEYFNHHNYNGNRMQQEFQSQIPEENEYDFDDDKP